MTRAVTPLKHISPWTGVHKLQLAFSRARRKDARRKFKPPVSTFRDESSVLLPTQEQRPQGTAEPINEENGSTSTGFTHANMIRGLFNQQTLKVRKLSYIVHVHTCPKGNAWCT